MQAYAVSRAVNSVKNDTEECIEPLPGEPPPSPAAASREGRRPMAGRRPPGDDCD